MGVLRSSSTEDLGLEQALVFVLVLAPSLLRALLRAAASPLLPEAALGESIPESLGESNLRTLYLVTVAADVLDDDAASAPSALSGSARFLVVMVTVAADVAVALVVMVLAMLIPTFMFMAGRVSAFMSTLPLTLRSCVVSLDTSLVQLLSELETEPMGLRLLLLSSVEVDECVSEECGLPFPVESLSTGQEPAAGCASAQRW